MTNKSLEICVVFPSTGIDLNELSKIQSVIKALEAIPINTPNVDTRRFVFHNEADQKYSAVMVDYSTIADELENKNDSLGDEFRAVMTLTGNLQIPDIYPSKDGSLRYKAGQKIFTASQIDTILTT